MACSNNLITVFSNLQNFSSLDALGGFFTADIEFSILQFIGEPQLLDFSVTIEVDSIREDNSALNDNPISETYNYSFTNSPAQIYQPLKFWYNPNFNANYEYLSRVNVKIESLGGCVFSTTFYYRYTVSNYTDGINIENIVKEQNAILRGCKDPIAINFNPRAIYNDGSCIYQSGCTNPIASNFNEFALYDDGTCDCEDPILSLDFNEYEVGYTFPSGCTHVWEFDYYFNIDCLSFLEDVDRRESTILAQLEQLGLQFSTFNYREEGEPVFYTGSTIPLDDGEFVVASNATFWQFEQMPIYPFGLIGDGCQDFLDLLSLELGLDCDKLTLDNFKPQYQRVVVPIDNQLANQFLKTGIRLNNFDFKVCLYLDNIKVYEVCDEERIECLVISRDFGFKLNRSIDNKKSWSFDNPNRPYQFEDERLIMNTKQLVSRISPSSLIEKDVDDWHNLEYGTRLNLLKPTPINPIDRQTIRAYPSIRAIYDEYLYPENCKESKRMTYSQALNLIQYVPSYFYDLSDSMLPMTAINYGGNIGIRNLIFDQEKHKYIRFSLREGTDSGFCATGFTFECNEILENCVESNPYRIEDILFNSNLECTGTTIDNTICVRNDGVDDNTFSGRIVQYEIVEGTNVIGLYDGFDGIDCAITNVSGCTDVEAYNYNPLATIDDGSCLYCFDGDVLGCTYSDALNYNPLATIDDGSCIFPNQPDILECGGDFENATFILTATFDWFDATTAVLSFDLQGTYPNVFSSINMDNIWKYNRLTTGEHPKLDLPTHGFNSSDQDGGGNSGGSFNAGSLGTIDAPIPTSSNRLSLGYNGLTPNPVTSTDSPWVLLLDLTQFQFGAPPTTIPIEVTIFDENTYCYKRLVTGVGGIATPVNEGGTVISIFNIQ